MVHGQSINNHEYISMDNEFESELVDVIIILSSHDSKYLESSRKRTKRQLIKRHKKT